MKKLVAGIALAALPLAVAAAYPDRPIKLIVPWPAGGDTDNIFRPYAPLMQKHIGQTVVIANVAGASGTRGAKEAKESPPDGYTIYGVHDYIHSTYYTGVADVNYHDFEPVCLVSSTPSVLTASPKTPWNDWKTLLADAKARPGQITVGATLGILQRPPAQALRAIRDRAAARRGIDAAAVERKIAERAAARKAKDFARGDAIRDELLAMGVAIQDGQDGTSWKVE